MTITVPEDEGETYNSGYVNRIVPTDLTGDLVPELAVDIWNSIHVFDRQAQEIFYRVGYTIPGTFAVGDINGDDHHDLVVNGIIGNTWGWDNDGDEIQGMPLPLDYRYGNTNPCIVDIQNSGSSKELLVFAVTLNGSKISVYETDGIGISYWPEEGYDKKATNSVSVLRGDANHDGIVNSTDGSYLADYLFASGNSILTFKAGDYNDDNLINISDVIELLGL